MRKVFALLLVMLACFTAFLAAETTELKLKVCRNDGQDYECLLSNVDNVKFIIGDKGIEKEADSRDYIDAGALTAASYKVSDSTSVYFSQGNLQFNAMLGTHQTADGTAQGTWRFAEKQYDVVGYANENIDSTYFGWIDLFGWGTSGWNSGANVYQPWSTNNSENNFDYYSGGSWSNDLTGTYANADWGVYNAISNGGNEPNKWRTLTYSEWCYLLENNKWTLGYIKTTEKDSSLCYMLIPETFIAPEGACVTVLTTGFDSVPSTNKYTTKQFAALEKSGVVALPCGGFRVGSTISRLDDLRGYWSSSAVNHAFFFYTDEFFFLRWFGFSVRLVQDGADIHFVNADGTTLLDTVVARGVIPTYTREKPTMDSKVYTFEFKGWNKKVVAAECDMVYTAVYDSFPMLYTSVFKDYDGTTIKTIEKCTYDSVLAETPTRESIIQDYDYEFLEWKRDESKISDKQLVYTAVYSMKYTGEKSGVIQAAYKVSDTKSVYFSRGNLQYCAGNGTGHKTADGTIAQGTWRFAENQWDVVGEGNANIDSTYTGWIDLFGWGTSGWNSKAICYQPWSKSKSYSDYYSGGSSSDRLTGDYANADWGGYNAISNGGNEPNKWRSLTYDEWAYLLQYNKWTLGYIKTTEKDSSLCFFLIPNGFVEPSDVKVAVISTRKEFPDNLDLLKGSYVGNVYTMEQFESLERLGVVALPCGGFRNGTPVYVVGSHGYYWSSSACDSNDAYEFGFDSTYVRSGYHDYRFSGRSVRLVQDGADIHFVNPDGTTLLDTVVERGVIPTYTREKPTMDPKAYTFEFKGWNKKVVAAECDMVYTAVYDSFPVLYTSVFKDYDGTTIKTIEKCTYDSVLAETPTRESIIQDYDYEFLEWKRDENKISDKQLVYTAVYSMKYTGEKSGVIQAAYKVSDTKSVYFSRGNLQYCAGNGTGHKTADGTIAQGTWRFAENQWDVVGEGNANIDSTYTGWIDLFGWGTSGWNSKAPCYQPWSKSETYSDYYPGGSYSNSLTGTYANADWGVYNAISNGGNEPNKWRNLTDLEWYYLLQNNKWTLGYINGGTNSYLCFMLIPETFEAPEGTSVEVLDTAYLTSTWMTILTVPSTNTYTTDEFASLEKLGVVALPCGGYRNGASVYNVGSRGYDWSSSANDSYSACGFNFDSTYVNSSNYYDRSNGGSVRLVQDVP